MRRAVVAGVVVVIGVVGTQASAQAGIPQVISFQGRLADANGKAVTEAVDVTFGLYTQDTGGTAVWAETHAGLTPADGLFSIMLGSVSAFSDAGVDFTQELWLGVKVGDDDEMTPRLELASAPYAMRAASAAATDTVDWAGVANVPADLADGDADTVYTEGTGILISGEAISVDTAEIAPAAHDHDAAYVNDGAGEIDAAGDFGFAAPTQVANLDADMVDGKEAADLLDKATYDADADGEVDSAASSGDADTIDGKHLADLDADYVNVAGDVMTGDLRAPKVTGSAASVGFEMDVSTPSGNTPVAIPDNNPAGVTDTITLPDTGVVEGFSVTVDITNSDISTVRVELTAPDATPYVLYDGGSTGTDIETSYPDPTPPVSGDLAAWVGQNLAGDWTLKIIDSGFKDNTTDGEITGWSIQSLAPLAERVTVRDGDLLVTDGNVGIGTESPGAKLEVHGEVKSVVGGQEFFMVPKGGIIMWSGTLATIPSGWQLCDGTNGTPDLRNRFIQSVQSGENPGTVAGSHSVTLTTTNMPNHRHGFTTGGQSSSHKHWTSWEVLSNYATAVTGGQFGVYSLADGTSGAYDVETSIQIGSHTHSGNTDYTGGGQPFNNRPGYYELAFIMKL